MKFAYINAFWEYGSTGRHMKNNFHLLQSEGHEVRCYYGMNKQKDTPEGVVFYGNKFISLIHHVIAYFFGLAGYGSVLPTLKLVRDLKKFNPDIVWLYNIHGFHLNENILFRYLKKSKPFIFYSMADEYAFCGKCCSSFDCKKFKNPEGCSHCEHLQGYPRSRFFDNSRRKFKQKEKNYRGIENILFSSAPYVVEKAKSSWLLRDREFSSSDAGIDVKNTFYPRDTKEIREEFGISENSIVALCCAPISDELKGVKHFMEAATLCKDRDIVFINVAFDGNVADCPKNYIPIYYVNDRNKMAALYSLADVYVCPSLSDAQPNTCIEALGCGTPIVGFNVSGVPYIAPAGIGTYVTGGSSEELAAAIRAIPKKDAATIEKCRSYACERYSREKANERKKLLIAELCRRANACKEQKSR